MISYKVTLRDGSQKIIHVRDYNQAVPTLNRKMQTGEWKDYEVLPIERR